jgi:tripartite-type tricarboxylate transporter receptor subunit TctC
VQGAFLNSTVATQQVRAGGGGRLRALAATSTTRWRELPEVPTVAEMGWPDYEASAWYGFLAPAGLPASILDRLHRDIAAALRLPEVRARLMGAGLDLLEVGPERFGALIAEDLAKWTRVVRAARLRAD